MLIISIFLLPVVVKAEVTGTSPEIKWFDDKESCVSAMSVNGANQNVIEGFFLTCTEVKCINSKLQHTDLWKLTDKITCQNGNRNPKVDIRATLLNSDELLYGASCTTDPDKQYTSQRLQYNCALSADGKTYTSTNSNSNNTTQANTNGNAAVNPQTGIETYYLVLGSVVVILGGALYYINKKNLFKKI